MVTKDDHLNKLGPWPPKGLASQYSSDDSASDQFLQLLSIDGHEMGAGALAIICVAIVIYILQIAAAIYNAVKFYRHRSYALGLFYILCIVNFLFRMSFFIYNLFRVDSYWNVVFLCYPASFSCAIGLCQIMNYSVLYIRLDSYAKHRAIKGDEISAEDLEKTTKKEMLTTLVFTIGIISYPLVISILLAHQATDFQGKVLLTWEKYQYFYMMNVILITILLVISTLLALRHMRKVFGEQSMSEEKTIWVLLLIFCGTYVVRVILTVAMYFYRQGVAHVFHHDHNYFLLSVLGLWIVWDSIPLCSMLVTHYKNFSSFSNDEILYTEYSVDDDRQSFMSYARSSMTYHNYEETSGVINLDSNESSSSSSSNDEEIHGLELPPNHLNQEKRQKSIINKSQRAQTLAKRLANKKPSRVSHSLGTHANPLVTLGESAQFTNSQEDPQNGSAARSTSRDGRLVIRSQSKTSRTVSAGMLKWSLARSIKLGIFSKRVFTREMVKAQTRKSTIDSKQRLLILPGSEEARKMALSESKRSRSTVDLHANSDSEGDDDDKKEGLLDGTINDKL